MLQVSSKKHYDRHSSKSNETVDSVVSPCVNTFAKILIEYIRIIRSRSERSSMNVVEMVLSMSRFYENDLRPGTNLICKAKSKLD